MTPSDIATSEKTTIPYEATVCQITPENANKIQTAKFQFIEQNKTNAGRFSVGGNYLFTAKQVYAIQANFLMRTTL